MATVESLTPVQQIGDTAGLVWKTLAEQGPLSLSKLVKSVAVPRDSVLQAVGWLAREDKLDFIENGRTRLVALK